MEYTEYSYLWPPRPDKAIPTAMLGFYERRNWVAQIKKNGTCTMIFTNGTDVIFKTRHNDDHKMWNPTSDITEFFRNSVTDGKWTVFVAELLHSKTKNIKNTIYVFDIVVAHGEHLVGSTFEVRQKLIEELLGRGQEQSDHFVIHPRVLRAKTIRGDFAKVWGALDSEEDEGLVLKNPLARMEPCFKQKANSTWQVKCRVLHKNYSF